MSDVPDLLAALQRSIDAAKRQRKEEDSRCRFDSLREHKSSECPLCNPDDWMAQP